MVIFQIHKSRCLIGLNQVNKGILFLVLKKNMKTKAKVIWFFRLFIFYCTLLILQTYGTNQAPTGIFI